jgi:hypothetical protein
MHICVPLFTETIIYLYSYIHDMQHNIVHTWTILVHVKKIKSQEVKKII